ncbi:unnamed protein product, partial [Owenia fusiformis]
QSVCTKMPSRIFTGFRALGYNSTHVPLVVRHHKKREENYVVTSVGKAFHVYNCSKLGIVNISNLHPDEINCLAVDAYLTFTACQNVIRAYKHGTQLVHTYKQHDKDVQLLLPFGDHLISVDTNSCVIIWNIESEEIHLELSFSNTVFQVTAICHPSTYVNKVVFGSKQGSLQLWNIKSGKQIHAFKDFNAPITVLEQAPAIDVLGIGFADGRTMLHNIRYNQTIMTVTQDWGPVTAISFRTDGSPIMAVGSPLGHIGVWNLEEKRLISQIQEAHNSAVSGMQFLPSEPIMVTNSADNSVKMWIFDQADGGGRLLRQRTGHSAPPNKVRFHDQQGQNILSAGQDSTLRSFSTVHDRHNKSLGRASFNKAQSKKSGLKLDQHMMPPIIDFASETNRQSDWDSIVACHRGINITTSWNYTRSTMGKYKLQHPRFSKDATYATATAQVATLSSCGNFCVIGYSSGHVDVYNMQSGLHRGEYGQPQAHEGSIRGVAIDALNQQTITAASDCTIKFWKFKQKTLLGTLTLDSPVALIHLHRESAMMAVALDDFTVVMVDITSRKVVRKFEGHSNRVTDMTFSVDARWLLTASMDCSLRTWDVPTGRLLDCALVDRAITSMSMSPIGSLLATGHLDDVGVYIWSNMTLYTHVNLLPLSENYEPTLLDMPSTGKREAGEEDDVYIKEEKMSSTEFVSPEQLADNLATLSTLPNSRWQNLLQLDTIKERNKPKQPPKVPKSAPFFLPTVKDLELKFDLTPEEKKKKVDFDSAAIYSLQLSKFGTTLKEAAVKKEYDPVLSAMKEMSVSSIDVELRLLAPVGDTSPLLTNFLEFLEHMFTTRRDFELAQAWLALFLKIHGDVIARNDDLLHVTGRICKSQETMWKGLQQKLNQSTCLVNYLKSATLTI